MGTSPFFNWVTLASLLSTQTTVLPVSAKQVPVTKPTYPVPTTAIFIMIYPLCNYLLQYSKTLELIKSSCSSSSSVCIGNEMTLSVSQSVIGKFRDAESNCSNI